MDARLDLGAGPRLRARNPTVIYDEMTPMQIPNHAPIAELFVSYESAQKLKQDAGEMPSWDLTPRQICDLELLMNGGFHPLKGFLSKPITIPLWTICGSLTAHFGRCR